MLRRPLALCTFHIALLLLSAGCGRQTDPQVPATAAGVDTSAAASDSVAPSVDPPSNEGTDSAAPASTASAGQQDDTLPTALPTTADELKALRAQHDASTWSTEVLAQQHEATFVALWDDLIHRDDKFTVLKEFRLKSLRVGSTPEDEPLDWQILRTRFAAPIREVSGEEWPAWIDSFADAGYRIVETEFHHSAFVPIDEGGPSSQVAFLIHATHEQRKQRFIVRGNLQVRWLPDPDPATGRYLVDGIDATDIHVLHRTGEPAFRDQRVDRFPTDGTGQKAPTAIHPVILQDLNQDGLPEVIVGAYNHVYVNEGNWKFSSRRLCDTPVPHINAAAFADFDGDGHLDYLAAMKNGYPVLYRGEAGGRFPGRPEPITQIPERLRVPINVVPGDIDNDGDLDVFIGQQKPGYFNGDIPTPYYDARDSFPAYLLLNEGQGNFRDITAEAGLGDKARRRNFAASFIDYDTDGDLDLILTSDFSGTDLFENDGSGKFRDVSAQVEPQAYAFGMSHTFGDYNLDGAIDFLTVGMSSTTARRLEQMRLGRKDFADYDQARMKMGYGNRLYLFQQGRFVEAPFQQDVARTGWSWGSTTLDFDNDADPDLYVVNGQTSGATTKDYCTSFWCHDVYYKRGERPDEAIRELFNEMTPLFSGHGISWNGYEHNALLMNLGGEGFVNVGFLMNVSYEFDSRAAVSGDLDGDGRMDLIVEHKDLRANEAKLYFARNVWSAGGHYVGVHLRGAASAPSPLGARVVLTLEDGRTLVQHNVAGHSVWVQHANTVHFGLGSATTVKALDVHWPNGATSHLERPAVDQYHVVTASAR